MYVCIHTNKYKKPSKHQRKIENIWQQMNIHLLTKLHILRVGEKVTPVNIKVRSGLHLLNSVGRLWKIRI